MPHHAARTNGVQRRADKQQHREQREQRPVLRCGVALPSPTIVLFPGRSCSITTIGELAIQPLYPMQNPKQYSLDAKPMWLGTRYELM